MSENTSPEAVKNNNTAEDDEMVITINFVDILKGFFKFWWVCVVLAVLFGGVMFFKYYVQFVPRYSVSATFTVTTESTDKAVGSSSYQYYFNQSTANQLSDTFPTILGTTMMQNALKEALGIPAIPASISLSAVKGTNMFTITASGLDPQKTYDTLMATVKCYPDVAKYVVGNIKIKIINEPQVPEKPSNSSDYLKKTLIGMIAGVVAGLCWILAYAIFRSTIRTEEDVKEALNTELLGLLPTVIFKKYKEEIDHSILITNPMVPTHYTEEIKVLRNTILQKAKDRKVLMLTSTAPGEGKTTISVNLALSMAQADRKILLIDGDLRNPSVYYTLKHEEFEPETDSAFEIKKDVAENLDILTFNIKGHDILGIMQYEKLKEIMESLRDKYDNIIVDTPPCGLISDALSFAQVVDGAVYVVLHDAVRTSRIRNSLDMLNGTDVDLIGCIITGTTTGLTSGYGYNKYSYGKYAYGYGRYGKGRYGYYNQYNDRYGKYKDYGYSDKKKK